MHGLIKLGMYLPFIFIACIEVVFALFYFGKFLKESNILKSQQILMDI